jgi:hypothetical protein
MARARFQIKPEPSQVRADSVCRGQAATDISHPIEVYPTKSSPVASRGQPSFWLSHIKPPPTPKGSSFGTQKLLSDPTLLESATINFRETIGSSLASNRSLLVGRSLLPVLFLHDLGAQIADSIDNARKCCAHLGLEVAIVQATLFERTLRRFDA